MGGGEEERVVGQCHSKPTSEKYPERFDWRNNVTRSTKFTHFRLQGVNVYLCQTECQLGNCVHFSIEMVLDHQFIVANVLNHVYQTIRFMVHVSLIEH